MPQFRDNLSLQAVAAGLLLVIAAAAGVSLFFAARLGGQLGVLFGLSAPRTHAVKERAG